MPASTRRAVRPLPAAGRTARHRWVCTAALGLCLAVPAQATLSQRQLQGQQVLIGGFNPSISDAFGDGAAPTLVDTRPHSFAQFDAQWGVLLGASGTLTVDPGQELMAYRGVNGGKWVSTATVRATWQVGSNPSLVAVSGSTGLAQAVADRDHPVVYTSNWSSLAWQAPIAALDSLVGTGALATQLSTSLSALKEPQSSGSSAIASLVTASSAGLTGALALQYSYLQHANASFAAGSDLDQHSLVLAPGETAQTFSVFALAGSAGAANTTGLDLLGWQCSGDCSSFQLGLAGLDAAVAGSHAGGWVQALGTGQATYTLRLGDDHLVGAAASRQQFELVLNVSAVPEPGTWALWAAGLAALGGLSARRRPR